jgi:hypothetical protein
MPNQYAQCREPVYQQNCKCDTGFETRVLAFSADEEARGYQPVLAERLKHDTEYAPSPAVQWPRDTSE